MYVQTIVYIISRHPSSVINMSPYEKLYNRQPSLAKSSKILCYANIMNQINKFLLKSKPIMLWGAYKFKRDTIFMILKMDHSL